MYNVYFVKRKFESLHNTDLKYHQTPFGCKSDLFALENISQMSKHFIFEGKSVASVLDL